MPDDVILSIGADNEPLKQKISDAEQLIDQYADRLKTELRGDDIAGDFEIPVEVNEVSIIDAKEKVKEIGDEVSEVGDKIKEWSDDATTFAITLARIAGIAAAVLAFGVKIKDAIIDQQKEQSGLNREMERSEELEKDRLKLLKERLGLLSARAKEEIDDTGVSKTLRGLRDETFRLNEAVTNAEISIGVEASGLASVEAEQGPLSSLSATERRLHAHAQSRLEEARKSHKESKEALEKHLAVVKELEEKEAKSLNTRLEGQRVLKQAIEDEISVKKEAALRVEGDDRSADAVRDQRLRRQRTEQYSALGEDGAKRAADELAAVDERLRKSKKKDSDDKKNRADAERFQREREQSEERIAAQRQRIAEFDEDSTVRLNRMKEDFEARQERTRRSKLGGVDSSLEAAVSRIQNAASKPSDDSEKAFRAKIERFEDDKMKHRTRLESKLDAIIAKEPEKPQGLL